MQTIAETRVLIKGAGDLATGVALRLVRCGFPVILTELARPMAVRRGAAFAQAVFDGSTQIEDVRAAVASSPAAVDALLAAGVFPVLVAPDAGTLSSLRPAVLVDAIMAKRNTGTRIEDAPLVVALGPGFCAGIDCHAVIETNRGHRLGRVIRQGSAEANTGVAGEVSGAGAPRDRVLRAPAAGRLVPAARIGDMLAAGDLIARIEAPDESAEVCASFAGILRGLLHESVPVVVGLKIGDLDARAERSACYTASDKALAIGGGVLEAILASMRTTAST